MNEEYNSKSYPYLSEWVNKEGLTFKLIGRTKFSNGYRYYIEFTKSGYITDVVYSSIKTGSVKDKMSPSVYGIGIVGDGVVSKNGKHFESYTKWSSMIQRVSIQKSYHNCSISDEFLYYPTFKKFYDENSTSGFDMDKDLLIPLNREYSRDSICFLPPEINNSITTNNVNNDRYMVGVKYNLKTDRYESQCCSGGKSGRYLNTFDTEIEAHLDYLSHKNKHIWDLADKYKDVLTPKVYEALINYDAEKYIYGEFNETTKN